MRHIRIIIILLVLCHVSALSAQRDKMSSYLRRLTMEQTLNGKTKRVAKAESPITTVLLKTSHTGKHEELHQAGCRILHSWGNIHAVVIPIKQLQQLASMPEVLRIEANEPCMLTNDTTAHITNVQHNPLYPIVNRDTNGNLINSDVRTEYGLTGKGVVVGVEDIGFDLTHPSYLSPTTGECRVRALWDQLDQTEDGEEMPVGRKFSTPQQIATKQHTADAHLSSHGTHTSNTAAGSGLEGLHQQSIYGGMAPEADICLVSNIVSTNKEVVPEEKHPLYTTATDLLGFQYIFDYATSVDKPCVINFSEGQHQDLDENQLYNEVLKEMVGPGRILCSSAGNEGQNGSYIHKEQGMNKAGAFLTSKSTQAYYTLRSDSPANIKLTFYNADGKSAEWNSDAELLKNNPDSLFTDTVDIAGSLCTIMYICYPTCFDESKLATELLIIDMNNYRIGSGNRSISLQVTGINNDIEVFASGSGYFTTNNRDLSLNDYTLDHNVLFPGSAEDVICVGNSSYRTSFLNVDGNWLTLFGTDKQDGMLSQYSSTGPSMEGLTKPDVSAPGMNVISALSSWYNDASRERDNDRVSLFQHNGRTYGWWAESGTSMSSPVVTGIIALWLEMCPTLSPDDVKTIFEHTCTHPVLATSWPNNQYGYGNIDALAGARYIEENLADGIKQVNNTTVSQTEGIYDLAGRRVSSASIPKGLYIVNGHKIIYGNLR